MVVAAEISSEAMTRILNGKVRPGGDEMSTDCCSWRGEICWRLAAGESGDRLALRLAPTAGEVCL